MPRVQESDSVEICCGCGWAQATIDGYCLDCAPSWAEGVCNPWDNDHEHEWDCDD